MLSPSGRRQRWRGGPAGAPGPSLGSAAWQGTGRAGQALRKVRLHDGAARLRRHNTGPTSEPHCTAARLAGASAAAVLSTVAAAAAATGWVGGATPSARGRRATSTHLQALDILHHLLQKVGGIGSLGVGHQQPQRLEPAGCGARAGSGAGRTGQRWLQRAQMGYHRACRSLAGAIRCQAGGDVSTQIARSAAGTMSRGVTGRHPPLVDARSPTRLRLHVHSMEKHTA